MGCLKAADSWHWRMNKKHGWLGDKYYKLPGYPDVYFFAYFWYTVNTLLHLCGGRIIDLLLVNVGWRRITLFTDATATSGSLRTKFFFEELPRLLVLVIFGFVALLVLIILLLARAFSEILIVVAIISAMCFAFLGALWVIFWLDASRVKVAP